MVLVAHYDLELHQMDVKIDHLNESLRKKSIWINLRVPPLKEKNNWLATLRSQYTDLNKLPNNGTLSSMISLHNLDLKKILLIGAFI
jgi:hypothetical protein